MKAANGSNLVYNQHLQFLPTAVTKSRSAPGWVCAGVRRWWRERRKVAVTARTLRAGGQAATGPLTTWSSLAEPLAPLPHKPRRSPGQVLQDLLLDESRHHSRPSGRDQQRRFHVGRPSAMWHLADSSFGLAGHLTSPHCRAASIAVSEQCGSERGVRGNAHQSVRGREQRAAAAAARARQMAAQIITRPEGQRSIINAGQRATRSGSQGEACGANQSWAPLYDLWLGLRGNDQRQS